ncbi:hypothetical protein [Paraburkholderia sp. J67]|uniref:hypothetical protein n=1 Tax=Paraburkholderia sp. J67 TaxID=2805435 RepID=UPI002ABD1F1E|nr:hypothetical protein [Paraburkholderia sp. J67]
MESVWEYKWAFWDDKANRFDQTPAWMTESEARSDWFYYTDPRSYAIEHTKRDRNRGADPIMDAPAADVDWTKERRRREEISRYGLPPFFTPSYAELRRMWKENRDETTRRLALEVQCGRHAIYELLALTSEVHFYLHKEPRSMEEACMAIGRIRRRLQREKDRIGPLLGDDR